MKTLTLPVFRPTARWWQTGEQHMLVTESSVKECALNYYMGSPGIIPSLNVHLNAAAFDVFV